MAGTPNWRFRGSAASLTPSVKRTTMSPGTKLGRAGLIDVVGDNAQRRAAFLLAEDLDLARGPDG